MAKDKKQNNEQAPISASPERKPRKKLGTKLPFSPKIRTPNVNKVFVVGAQLGLILIRTEKQNTKDDAFTNDAIKLIEDETSGVASQLNLIKICNRRESQLMDKAIMQTTNYASQWFISIVEDTENTETFRREHVDKFIHFLNNITWKYPQQFAFQGDETKHVNGSIIGTWDMYILNMDITSILKHYLYDDVGYFLEDKEAVAAVFAKSMTENKVRECLAFHWLNA